MRKPALSLLLCVLLVGVAAAEEESPTKALKRGFENGTFTDEYFGVSYTADGLKKGMGSGSGGVLFAGTLPGSTDVEILCAESPEKLTGIQWRDKARKQMAEDDTTRTDMATGDDPVPWITCVEESFAGFERPRGFAFYARGHQVFVVRVKVREPSETSSEQIKAALAGLTVKPDVDAMLFVHLVSKGSGLDLDDPKVLVQAADEYLKDDSLNVPFALKALEVAMAREDELEPLNRYVLYRTLGFAQLKAKDYEAAVPTWNKVAELSAGTGNPAAAESNARYNLACALSLLGRIEDGFQALQAAFEKGPEEQVTQLKQHAQQDPDLENLRKDPRWAEIVGGGEGAGEG